MSPEEKTTSHSPAPVESPPKGDAPPASPSAINETVYPHIYTWYVLVSALDVMFTWMMFHVYPQNAKELNFIAEYVMLRWDLGGMVMFKFVLVFLVICICEFVGRRRYALGRAIGLFAVGISCIPVIAAAVQMLLHNLE